LYYSKLIGVAQSVHCL